MRHSLFYISVFAWLVSSLLLHRECKAQVSADSSFTSLSEAMKDPLRVASLTIRGKRLKAFPTEILQMKNLRELNLSKNYIDLLPSELPELSKLELLDVSRNLLYSFPIRMAEMRHLRKVVANRNKLAFLADQMSGMTQLEHLDVWHNDLTSVPESFKSLVNLKYADFRENILDRDAQLQIKKLFPNTKLFFSATCSCGK
jgi:Leucine-rich repeat (LRR) protein